MIEEVTTYGGNHWKLGDKVLYNNNVGEIVQFISTSLAVVEFVDKTVMGEISRKQDIQLFYCEKVG